MSTLQVASLPPAHPAKQIPLSGDFRPFFTIHDADHASLVNPRPPKAGLLLGVTNPYFEQQHASEALHQHFTSRTTALLVPLQRYLQSLIPTPSESRSNLHDPGRLKPFNDAAFFASLKAHGSPLPFKSNAKQKEFYERWLRTPAFGLWLARQEEVVQGVLKGMMNSK
ncbi:hypothetical protein TRAPUB_4389 [Trametes pubescens]|uniref:Uncharacterized protein n=1 Tax=Trametes pubescens TaxID=154538 RepID=A0A1M2VBB0_TRAPU|nr:hypothetical protein TRAPUB_4389 [Trametes pubescens]